MNEGGQGSGAEWRRHWPLVAAATSAMSLASVSTASFGVMLLPIERDLGWSRTEIAAGPTLISVMVIATATLFGAAIDRFGPRLIASLALSALAAAIATFSQITGELWTWWTLWAVIGLASAAIPTLCVMPISRSFSAGRGLAIAVVLSGSGLSSFLVPIIANALVEDYGWRIAYVGLAGIWAAIVLPLAVLFLRLPLEPRVETPSDEQPPTAELPGLTVREGFTAGVFYKLLFATFASVFAGTALVLNLVPLLHFTGLGAATAAGVASSLGIATISGRILGGWLIDRYSASRIAASVTASSLVLPAALLLVPGSVPFSLAAVFAYGMMGGALAPSIAYLASRHLGPRSFGTLYATINAVMSIGVGLGPLLANAVYDRTQSYEPVLWGTIPMFALGALLYASLGPYPDFADRKAAD